MFPLPAFSPNSFQSPLCFSNPTQPYIFSLIITFQVQVVGLLDLCVWGHPLKCDQPTRGSTLKENWLYLRSLQLSTVPRLGRRRDLGPSPLHVRGLSDLTLIPAQLRWVQGYSVLSLRHCFTLVLVPSIFLLPFPSLSVNLGEGREVIKMAHLEPSTPLSSHSMRLDKLWIFALTPSASQISPVRAESWANLLEGK